MKASAAAKGFAPLPSVRDSQGVRPSPQTCLHAISVLLAVGSLFTYCTSAVVLQG